MTINQMMEKARAAQARFEDFNQRQVDAVVRAIGKTVYDNAECLAKMAVDETRMGVYEDKVAKNRGKSRIIWNHLKDKKSVGIIGFDEQPSIELTGELMKAADAVVATGGMNMVKAAYPSGKPAYGVGAGNVQVIVYREIDFKAAAEIIIAGRKFDYEGRGHSCAIHSDNLENIQYAGDKLTVSRLVVNQICSTSAGGSFFNGFAPTTTLGCGSWGNNSISENFGYIHLLNISRIGLYNAEAVQPSDDEIWGLEAGI